MIHIRQCNNNDFENILPLLKQLWPDKSLNSNSLRKIFDKAITSENQIYICAIVNQTITGFGTLSIKNNLWQEGNIAHIDELIVDNSYRRSGIGKQLLSELEKLAMQQNCLRIELDSAFHREEAHNFYKKLGYKNRAYKFSKEL